MKTFKIEKIDTRFGFLGRYAVVVDGEKIGEISPLYASQYGSKVVGYRTEVLLEEDGLCDDGGFPNQYRSLALAQFAVADMMARNGIVHEPSKLTPRQQEVLDSLGDGFRLLGELRGPTADTLRIRQLIGWDIDDDGAADDHRRVRLTDAGRELLSAAAAAPRMR